MNVLILSCGTRNKIVQYFKEACDGLVIATDCSELAPALYDADKHYIVPRIDESGYLEIILEICQTNQVGGVMTLIDPEISLLAQNREKFLAIGTIPFVSSYELVEMCYDKHLFLNFLANNGFNQIKTYIDKNEFYADQRKGVIDYPVFVKPIRGSASININIVVNQAELELLFDRYDSLLIQEYMQGTEFGVDVYTDMISNEVVAIFIKEKILMRAGETDKAVAQKPQDLFELVEKFVSLAGFKGVIDIDVFKVDGQYFISEVNPRFGGGYPHAYACGVNIPKMMINNLKNQSNQNVIGDYPEGVVMMKYNEVKILNSLG
jgi:carbamoyl-phosphate synthase large subunit